MLSHAKKSVEIVFVDSTRRRQVQLPNPLDGIPRVSSIKILGVTVSNYLSVSEMCPLLSVDVHKPYTPSEFFAHRDFGMKLYIVSISQ